MLMFVLQYDNQLPIVVKTDRKWNFVALILRKNTRKIFLLFEQSSHQISILDTCARTCFHFEIIISASHWQNYILYALFLLLFLSWLYPVSFPFFRPLSARFSSTSSVFLCPTGHFAYFAVEARILKRRSHRIITYSFRTSPPSPRVPATLAISFFSPFFFFVDCVFFLFFAV